MASNHVLLFAAALLAVTFYCEPGWGVPHNALQGCRDYVVSRSCGVGPGLPLPAMKEQCCRELAAVPTWCRCSALLYFMDGVVTGQGVFEGKYLQDLPGCPREAQRLFANTLTGPEECNQVPIMQGGQYCFSLTALQMPK